MQEIYFNRIGILRKSIHPKEIGWYITIQDDTQISGGCKVFTSNNIDFESDASDAAKIVFDHWYETELHVSKGIEAWGREIEWTNNYITIEWADDMKSWKWKKMDK